MSKIFAKLKLIAEKPKLSIANSMYGDEEIWEEVFAFFAQSIESQRLADVFFENVMDFPHGRYFLSFASDERSSPDLNYKIYTADYMNCAAKRCQKLGIEIPKDVNERIELAKISCFYYEMRVDEDSISIVFNNRRYIFKDNICRLEDAEKVQWVKSMFNTYCLAYELAFTEIQNIDKVQALILHGADLEAAKRICDNINVGRWAQT